MNLNFSLLMFVLYGDAFLKKSRQKFGVLTSACSTREAMAFFTRSSGSSPGGRIRSSKSSTSNPFAIFSKVRTVTLDE